MTDEEKKMRDVDRKLMVEFRRRKREHSKKMAAMTEEERIEYYRKAAEELRAKGINVG